MKARMLQKIKRNLDMMAIASTSDATNITVDGMVISLVDASIAAPMGGIDPTVSPFLGIGVAAPSKIKLKGAAGENSIAAIMDSQLRLQVMHICSGFSNNLLIEAGDTATQLAEIQGAVDVLNVGT